MRRETFIKNTTIFCWRIFEKNCTFTVQDDLFRDFIDRNVWNIGHMYYNITAVIFSQAIYFDFDLYGQTWKVEYRKKMHLVLRNIELNQYARCIYKWIRFSALVQTIRKIPACLLFARVYFIVCCSFYFSLHSVQ